MENRKLFLLDAFALIFRAYYALIRSPRVTTTGRNTNAQFGFTNTLIELLNKEKPTHLAVAFDTHAPTERHTDFAAYKANRQETPEDLLAAVPDIKRIIKALNIPVIECDGYEADDVIGALAKQAEKSGYTVYMVTPDKDYGQLVSDKIKIYKPPFLGNKAEILGPAEVCEKWGIKNISQVIDMLGLMGDAVDNIPGIPGVGEKTAAKLLATYDTLENVLDHADEIKGALGEKVRKGKELAIMSKKLATIMLHVPVEFHEEDFRVKDFNREALSEVFNELEFKSLGKRILGEQFQVFQSSMAPAVLSAETVTTPVQKDLFGETVIPAASGVVREEVPEITTAAFNINNTTHHYALIVPETDALEELVHNLKQFKDICFDSETTGTDANAAELVGISFSTAKGIGYYVPLPDNRENTINILQHFRSLFEDQNIRWTGQNIKYDLMMLKRYGFELKGGLFDTMLAHYLIEPEGRRSMDLLSARYLNYEPVHIEELIGKKGKTQGSMRDVELEKIKEYAAEDADITLQLKSKFEPLLDSLEVKEVFDKVEIPLIRVLTDMEYAGIRIDEQFLHQYSVELEQDIREAEEKVYAASGTRFNLASPRQLGEILFDHLKLDPKAKKTKTGQYATGEDILLKLSHQHKIVDDILTFRELAKLKSTYVDALPQLINPVTGRVHTTYNQAVAVTGRLSSNNPNLQNIPIRTARGREVRKAFVPRNDNYTLLSADYSQIELRIVAAVSGDEAMCNAFRDKLDVHSATAARVFGVHMEEVSKEMRYKAKSVNFGLIYGQGAFGLAENLGISRTEAKELIETYFKQYSRIKHYMDEQIAFARANGYVKTLMGRKRWLRDIQSANATIRAFAERNAINMPIQGTAADMIKLAMIDIHAEMKKRNMKSIMLLQVHDELVFDTFKPEVDELKQLVLEKMENALVLPGGVPVTAECGTGNNWLEAH